MKVLFINTVPTQRNGITNVIFNYLNELNLDCLSIGYVSISEIGSDYKDMLQRKGINYYIIHRKLYSPWSYVYKLYKTMKDYDIVHVHGNSATMVLEMIAARLSRVKIRIAHCHNTTCNMKLIDFLARPLFYKLCNVRIACGVEAGKWLFRNRSFKVLNNGIDTDKFTFNETNRTEIRKSLSLNDEDILIGHVGNLVEQKNHRFLLSVFSKFRIKNPSSKLLLLGDGPLKNEIKILIESEKLTNSVIFLGSIDNPEKYLNAMDIVVMPSLHEGLPLTLVEEQANGLTVLASDNITRSSNISGLIHFASLNQSSEEWSKLITSLLKYIKHDSVASQMAIRKIKKAKYDINIVSKDLQEYYNYLIRHV